MPRRGLLLAGFLVASSSCKKEATVPPEIPPPAAADATSPNHGGGSDDDDEFADDTPQTKTKVGFGSPKLDAITLAKRPDWTDKYAYSAPDQRRFKISKVMADYGLARDAAVEVQNLYRDLAVADPDANLDGLLAKAVSRVNQGEYEDRRDTERLAKAKFIVVFDLDSTLYDQHVPESIGERCHDIKLQAEGKTRYIKLVPGWDETIKRINALGGAVVLFTANTDERSWDNGRVWMLDGKPIVDSPLVAGFLTNSHLVQQSKDEGTPVQEPSKDLRIFDESLSRAIIVDDNPERLIQPANTRVFKKFNAESACTTEDPKVRKAYERALPAVLAEIEASVAYMDKAGVSFAEAYRPYTAMGQVAVVWAMGALGLSEKKAIEWVRAHPTQVDPSF